ncbi:hypothetical protein [Micromonospora sp. SL4-19]|uniref:hypothetical protein n=1 Tax=Micromonospora sp. SL4-19 TaxID=3399129 RepID=UPI003A4DF748
MGVNVELRQHGPRPRKGRAETTLVDEIVDWDDLFVGLLNKVYNQGRTPTFDRIDPYGDLVLAGDAMTQLLAELPALVVAAATQAEKSFLASLEGLALRCAADPSDHYLHFVGD